MIFQMGDPEKRRIVCFYFKIIITISVYNINYILLLGICNDLPSLFPIQFQTVYMLVLPSARCESHKAPWDCVNSSQTDVIISTITIQSHKNHLPKTMVTKQPIQVNKNIL